MKISKNVSTTYTLELDEKELFALQYNLSSYLGYLQSKNKYTVESPSESFSFVTLNEMLCHIAAIRDKP